MDKTTIETRKESFIKTDKKTRQQEILDALEKEGELSAMELAIILGYRERNAVAPRLTELKAMGLVENAGTMWDCTTGRRVALWKIKNQVDCLGNDLLEDELDNKVLNDFITNNL